MTTLLRLSPPAGRPLRVLALGAHADDVEIGAGGTLLRLVAEQPGLEVHWVVLSAVAERAAEARTSAQAFLAGAGAAHVAVHELPESYFPAAWAEVKAVIQGLEPLDPDLVLTHRRADRHQDHRTVAELTWNSFRHQLVLEYEIPKYEGDLGDRGQPNLFVPLDEAVARRKVALLLEGFPSQAGRHWFDADTFLGLLRVRGLECAAPGRYAEAFHAAKVVL
ncbi:MAG: PIG-L family deacetylase [Acidimicrobiales bacterium]|nr:PIG-L family deacetylase [Acidimicrobiales bacterium]